MKTLIVMRHAKSSWSESGTPDHDRQLNDRGLRNAPAMGKFLCQQDLVPDLIVTSSATRAMKTTKLVAHEIEAVADASVRVETDPRLYLASSHQWLTRVPTYCNDEGPVMIVGHNPGLEELVAELTNQSIRIPTATIVVIQLKIQSWAELGSAGIGELQAVWRPKEVGVE